MIHQTEIGFVKVLIPFLLGICIAYFVQNEYFFDSSKILLCALFTCLTFIQIRYKKLGLWRRKVVIAILYFFVFFTAGAICCLINTDFLRTNYFADKNYSQLKVWINDEPQQSGDILRFEVEVTDGYQNQKAEFVSGKLLIALKLDSLSPLKLKYGDELIISGNYHPIESPYNPHEFNFRAWLAAKNIYQQSFIRQNQLYITKQNKGNPIIRYAIELRQKQVAIYRKLLKNDEAFAVASTLILGYRADLQKETLAAYSKTGTIHALSVSGMHVGIIYIMLNGLLAFLNRRKSMLVIKVIVIVFLIWAYSILTGFSPSVLRSAIMLSIFIVAKQFKRNSNNYNILAFSALALLVYNPFFIWDVGFQLSFISVFGLIYFQPKIYALLFVKNKYLDQLWNVVSLSLAAQLTTLPLSMYYFHQFPVYFILSNLFILVPITLMMYIGIAILLLKFYFLAPIFEAIIILNNEVLKWIANLPFSTMSNIWLQHWQVLILILVIAFLSITLIYRQKKALFIGLILFIGFQLSVSVQKLQSLFQKEIIFFSLRKNYAAAFINGRNAVLLSDLSMSDKNFDFFVRPALSQLQIEQIKLLSWEDNFQSPVFRKANHQIRFGQQQFLLLDSSFNKKKIVQKPTFNFVWLHKNVKYNPTYLQKDVQFISLIVDASNKDYYLKKIQHQADSLKIPIHILKKNPSFQLNID